MPADVSAFIAAAPAVTSGSIETMRRGVEVFGSMVVGQSQELAPVDTGAMQASGTWSPAVLNGNMISMTIGFNTNYAVFVHENLTAHHDIGQAKFMEVAMSNMGPAFVPFMTDWMASGGNLS